MTWKREIQLLDVDPNVRFEVTCKSCGYMQYIEVKTLVQKRGYNQLFLDQIEEKMRCMYKGCTCKCRIALPCPADTEGFQGGLA